MFHAWVICWPAGNDQVSVQPLIGSPRLVTDMLAVNPPGHCAGTVYDTEQPAVAACAVSTAAVVAIIVPTAAARASRVRSWAGIRSCAERRIPYSFRGTGDSWIDVRRAFGQTPPAPAPWHRQQ